MSLLALLATTDATPIVVDPEADTVPYAIPTAAPFNPPVYCVTPTPDGTGSTVHPSVLDFGTEGWNGHRYWMGHTPFYNSNSSLENPCLLVSDDGYTWTTPAGLTNPIDGPPGAGRWNSDIDIYHDPDTDRLGVVWRESGRINGGSTPWTEQLYHVDTADGATFSAQTKLVDVEALEDWVSPAIVRVAADDWWMFGGHKISRAPSPTGPWSVPFDYVWNGSNPDLWHVDVVLHEGVFYMIGDANGDAGLFPAVSTDGLTWTPGPICLSAAEPWDTPRIYRATMTLHPGGSKWRVWYSAMGEDSYRVGYTHLSMSLWSGLL